MPTKKKSVTSKKKTDSVAELYSALETAEKMKQKLFAKMQALLDKKRMENLKKKMKV
jgi:hypothetical protein